MAKPVNVSQYSVENPPSVRSLRRGDLPPPELPTPVENMAEAALSGPVRGVPVDLADPVIEPIKRNDPRGSEARELRRDVRMALSEALTTIDETGAIQDELINAIVRGVRANEPSIIKLAAAYRWGNPEPIPQEERAQPTRIELYSDAQLMAVISKG